jgi:hypothetical protein
MSSFKRAKNKKIIKKEMLWLKFLKGADFLHPSVNLAVDLRNIIR